MISDDEALFIARVRMSEIERKLILQLNRLEGNVYSWFADQIGETCGDTQKAGHSLQELKLAEIDTVRSRSERGSKEFNGSRLFLTKRGEVIKDVVYKLMHG